MPARELVVLGTASQAPTRHRNHNGYLLRWDAEGLLFDPGEGTQRQLLLAGVASSAINRICITHFHGDHCLGLPGVLQRLSLDHVSQPVDVWYPAAGQEFYDRLRRCALYNDTVDVRPHPVHEDGVVDPGPEPFTLAAVRLDHRAETFGWRVVEPDGRRMLPDRLEEAGIAGPDVGRLQREGSPGHGGRAGRDPRGDERGTGGARSSPSSWTPASATAPSPSPRGPTCWSASRPSWSATPTWRRPTGT